ncbi:MULTISPECIES: ReoY family proteolytic degradation factor [Carnobacterium]|uniref:ReoY family proteolytic degradation factor n=1 Tax=Carnobacterium TaxID=2747 RepID=UPI0007F5303B|nr:MULTISPECIES: ReoY family proteolytic degradation factor [Carnobacterium]MCO6017725.1 ReoY family proteolytic degradation factor [Carnobacterium divergens]MDT1938919.1 ReoY family proteolytic degradation factor [Carnobacterium divergens]MDT1941357.1 ReoY family proteolytic degradation factor [Carnobacterium divergens]MDT1947155.1 ReoY family proteolytic degradation factor [Carnobacterium divergens]MDT1949593.1 ReoY family proteolytic degradation factor [Carnobacterium divergens]
MSIKISLETKKAFLSLFLDRYQLKRRESMWIINYLLNHDVILSRVHFVEAVETTPRGMALSTVGTQEAPFQFYKEGTIFNDPEQAFHEVRLNWNDDLYVELFFQDQWQVPEYLAVLEDNPFHRWNDTISDQIKTDVEEALLTLTLAKQKTELLKKIDDALESQNKEDFIELSAALNSLEKEISRF